MVNKNREIKFTVSIGISEVSKKDEIDISINIADEALYEAKISGKNRICIR